MFERSRDRKGAAHQTVPLRSFLVPKLCLGTLSAKLRFALPSMAGQADAKQSFAKAVPKQSLGTRKCPAFLKLLLRERPIKPLLTVAARKALANRTATMRTLRVRDSGNEE